MFKFVIINNIMIEKILYSYALKYSRFWTNSSKNAITMLTYLSPKRKKLYLNCKNFTFLAIRMKKYVKTE